jgi:hypothetical protein
VLHVCRYRTWSIKNKSSKCCQKAEKLGIPYLGVIKGRLVLEHPQARLLGYQRWWRKYVDGRNDSCEFWVAGAPHSKEADANRAKNLFWTIFFRPMEEGEVGEEELREPEEEDEEDEDAPPNKRQKVETVTVTETEQASSVAEASSVAALPAAKATKGAKKAAENFEKPYLWNVGLVEVGDSLVLINPTSSLIVADVTVSHVWEQGHPVHVPGTLIGGKVLLLEGFVGITINKVKGEMPEKECKAFLAEFAYAGLSFDPLTDDYPAKLTTGSRAKLV